MASAAKSVETKLSQDVTVFLSRAVPHFMAGKSIEESLRAVIADDERLFAAIHDKRRSYYMPTCDERGRSYSTAEGKGDLIASELARTVYNRIRTEQVAS